MHCFGYTFSIIHRENGLINHPKQVIFCSPALSSLTSTKKMKIVEKS